MLSALLKHLGLKRRPPQAVDDSSGKYISPETVQRLIEEGEKLHPTSDEDRARLPKISHEEIQKLVRLGNKIAADPGFQRRLRDQIPDEKSA